MFSRHITMQIKKNWTPEFPKVIEKEVLPLLRRQKGFLDELILLGARQDRSSRHQLVGKQGIRRDL